MNSRKNSKQIVPKSEPFKSTLKIRQYKQIIYIEGTLSDEHAKVKQLKFIARHSTMEYQINSETASNRFLFKLNLNDHPNLYKDMEEIFNLYIVVTFDKKIANEHKLLKGKTEKDKGSQEYLLRLGGFDYTDTIDLQPIILDSDYCLFYKTIKGNISLRVNREIKPQIKTELQRFNFKNNQIQIEGELFTGNSEIMSIYLVIRNRSSHIKKELPLNVDLLSERTKQTYGLNYYKLNINTNLSELLKDGFSKLGIYDFYLEIKFHDYPENIRKRLGNPSFNTKTHTKATVMKINDGTEKIQVTPYFTKDYSNFSLKINEFESKLQKTIYKKFRKSKYYLPIMKKIYSLAKNLLPIKKQWILFESGVGKQFADNPKYIYKELIKINRGFKIIWVCNQNRNFKSKNTIQVTRMSPRYFYYLARSKVWINNQNFPSFLTKRKNTLYIQTWHGTPLKKMLYDLDEIWGRNEGYLDRIGNAVKEWDYLLSPNPYASNAFKSAFKYKGQIIETGYPRNDILVQNDTELYKNIKSKLKINSNKKVILYAPTFRDNYTERNNKFLFDINLDLEKLKKDLGNDFVIMLRMHLVISNKVVIDEKLKDFVIDVSDYQDTQELLLVTDLLITDYSSIMFDFANTRRPILFYTYDLEEYRDNIRGFYMDFEKEAPGPLLRTTEEIINSINYLENISKKYSVKYELFYNKYCSLEDGYASKRVVNLILNQLNDSKVD